MARIRRRMRHSKGAGVPPEAKALAREHIARKRQAGQQPHRPTRKSKELVITLRAAQWSVLRIARRLGISEPTCWKYYRTEIDEGADIVLAEMNKVVWKKARGGSLQAVKMVVEGVKTTPAPPDAMPDSIVAPTATPEPKAKKAPKLGKKEQAVLDAQHPDTETSLGGLMARRFH